MEDKFYPKIFTIADDKSKSSQNRYINFNRASLVLIIIFAISSIFTYNNQGPNWLIIICTAAVILSTLINIYILFRRPEKKWYEGRAIAESVKTLSWKYMVGSQPYDLMTNDVNILFKDNLKKIIRQDKDFLKLIGDEKNENYFITDKMKEIRSSDFKYRKQIYLNDRIQNQINWYSKNTKRNKIYKSITLILIILFQSVAVILFCIENFTELKFSYSFTSLLITLTTVSMTWLQMKRYQELTDAYSVTANELKKIHENEFNVTNDEDLNKYVDDSEAAISREHTLWMARRDNVELYN